MAHPDIDRLLNVLISLAKQMLDQAGEFHPFSCALDTRGQPVSMPPYAGEGQTTPEEVIEQLLQVLRSLASAGEIAAAGVCLDAWVVLPDTDVRTDAIEVRLEHATGQAVRVFLPYIKGYKEKPKYSEIFATPWEPCVFEGSTVDDA